MAATRSGIRKLKSGSINRAEECVPLVDFANREPHTRAASPRAMSVAAHGPISFRKGHHLHQMAAGVGGIMRLPDPQIAGLARGEQAGITCAGG
jgi:hypothetical protein